MLVPVARESHLKRQLTFDIKSRRNSVLAVLILSQTSVCTGIGWLEIDNSQYRLVILWQSRYLQLPRVAWRADYNIVLPPLVSQSIQIARPD